MKNTFDILIIGAGLVGLTAALACADSGAQVALIDRKTPTKGNDSRASALSATSLRLFENLGVDITEQLQPIHDMLVTEGVPNSPWRLHFEGGDSGGNDLGAIIENPDLKAALLKRVADTDLIQIFAPFTIQDYVEDSANIIIETDQGELRAKLLIAADGRDSVLRQKAGITSQRFDYDAASLVTIITHELPHDGVAWQRLIKGGALAALPLKGQRSQIVWSGPRKGIKAAEALSDTDFLALLSEKMDGYLGDMQCAAPRRSYPLRLQVADSFTKGRIALAGDAAHSIHPLAGQGFNLGLRDVAALAEGVKMSLSTGQDIGITSLLDYDLWRNTDTRSLGLLTHIIAQNSGNKFSGLGHLRRLGLTLVNRSTALKSELQKRAAGQGDDVPNLMQ